MKEFFKKNKKLLFGILAVWAMFLLLIVVMSIFSLVQSERFADRLFMTDGGENEFPGWNDEKTKNLIKEKWWLEQQLTLAKSESISLGINLKDSIVQVQLKGTVLFQAKILKQEPKQFFVLANEKVYRMLLAETSKIDSCRANIPKKPIKKVIAPLVGSEVSETKTDTLKENRLNWHFITNRGIEVVINGVLQNQDSTYSKIPVISDMMLFRLVGGFRKPFQPKNTALLYLWLDDQDAKAIYRALPDSAQVIFRD